ncbi:MAG: zinc metallopeptidase [Verrucomicrobiaceae bacterium]|nr:zinc metallopeptidase [Verrucomicrobiaceae bacterium]
MLAVPLILILAVFFVSKWALGRFESRMELGRRAQAPENITGAQIAEEFLNAHGAGDVQIVPHDGVISNYFDPSRRRLFLSKDVREGKHLAAWALALHEAAHALQKGEDKDAFVWRRTCIRLNRYIPMFTAFGCGALLAFMKMPFRNVFFVFVGICVLVMLLNLGTIAVENNANARLRRWMEERFSSSPSALEKMEILLSAIATRELGDLVNSPRYFFFSALPGTSGPRP